MDNFGLGPGDIALQVLPGGQVVDKEVSQAYPEATAKAIDQTWVSAPRVTARVLNLHSPHDLQIYEKVNELFGRGVLQIVDKRTDLVNNRYLCFLSWMVVTRETKSVQAGRSEKGLAILEQLLSSRLPGDEDVPADEDVPTDDQESCPDDGPAECSAYGAAGVPPHDKWSAGRPNWRQSAAYQTADEAEDEEA